MATLIISQHCQLSPTNEGHEGGHCYSGPRLKRTAPRQIRGGTWDGRPAESGAGRVAGHGSRGEGESVTLHSEPEPSTPGPPLSGWNELCFSCAEVDWLRLSIVRQAPLGKATTCLCSRPYDAWRTVGGYAPELANVHNTPTFLCEGCFRLALTSRALNLETTAVHEGEERAWGACWPPSFSSSFVMMFVKSVAWRENPPEGRIGPVVLVAGTLVATLRLPMATPLPPQPVGIASIPAMEIRAPTEIASLWKGQSRTTHHKRPSRDRIARRVSGLAGAVRWWQVAGWRVTGCLHVHRGHPHWRLSL
jgi:hypothetical protein